MKQRYFSFFFFASSLSLSLSFPGTATFQILTGNGGVFGRQARRRVLSARGSFQRHVLEILK